MSFGLNQHAKPANNHVRLPTLAQSSGNMGAPHSVLIVEDDHSVAHLFSILAEDCGYSWTWIDGAASLPHALRRADPDLILLDLSINGADGAGVLRILAEQKIRASIMIVSGADESVSAAACRSGRSLGLAMAGYLVKPFKIETLIGVLLAYDGTA